MKTTISTFKDTASFPSKAIVMMFDLEGFSKFFSQPDVQDYVPKFLNVVIDAVETNFKGGTLYWAPLKGNKIQKVGALPLPIHSKFLGDGALYIWNAKDFNEESLLILVNRFWTLKTHFNKVVEKTVDEVPIMDIPKNIRFGISAGSVYKLSYDNSNREEFIGYSINLASRLQSYCREIGFIVSGRTNIKTSSLEKHKYKRVVATKIKGFPEEIVIVDKVDFDRIPEEIREDIFHKA